MAAFWFSATLVLSSIVLGFAAGEGDAAACLQHLLPCQAYLHSDSPPPTCCFPIKQMLANDKQCVCGIFANEDLLKNLNLTKDEALKFAKSCDPNADISYCKNSNATAPPSTGSPPSIGSPPSTGSTPPIPSKGSSIPSTSSPNKETNAATGISLFDRSAFVALMVVLLYVFV